MVVQQVFLGTVQKFRAREGVKSEVVAAGGKKAFPEEQALSGWFKYTLPLQEVIVWLSGIF